MIFLHLRKLEPTVFFVRENDELKQVLELTVGNEGKAAEASYARGRETEQATRIPCPRG